MIDISYWKIFFHFVGGLGLLLYGMYIMADGLQKIAGSKMKKLLEVLTRSKLMSVIVGAFVTGLIHSSAAVTIMVVGFVNAGLMNLTQSVGIIMGANIGTTVTSWLISSVEWLEVLNPQNLAPIAVGLGTAMILFPKKEKIRHIGAITVGFGILFMGINEMTQACTPLSYSPHVKYAFLIMGQNPLLGFLAGIIVTAFLQSSSASVGILQSLAILNLVPWNSAVYIIMGQNIGTCITSLLSSIGTSKNAKATAYLHLTFNLTGSIIFSAIAIIFFTYINPQMGYEFIKLTQISIIHSVFNIGTTVLLYPFSNQLIKIAQFLVRNLKDDENEIPVHLDIRILENPNFAIQSCLKEIIRMGHIAKTNLKVSMQTLIELDEKKIEDVLKREKQIDILEHAITKYLVKICNTNMNRKDNKFLTRLFYTVSDIERIGDHCENIVDVAKYMIDEDLRFTAQSKQELSEIFNMTILCYKSSLKALEENDKMIAMQTVTMEENIDALEKDLRNIHIERLSNNQCDAKSHVAFLDTIANLERISDHALNISQVVLKCKSVKISDTQ